MAHLPSIRTSQLSSDSDRSPPYETAFESPMEESPTLEDSQQIALRLKILAIHKNTDLTAKEKARKIQALMSKKEIQSCEMDTTDESVLSEQDMAKTFNDKTLGILGCQHYQRSVKVQADCCKKWVNCRLCHDEGSDHIMDRTKTRNMLCMVCGTVQDVGENCTSCKARVAHYHCADCNLWDNNKHKSIFHCKDCGICRVGKGLGIDYFHCSKCNICMSITLQGNHKCIERSLECDCPICGEFMFTSTSLVMFMPCGHGIHYKCHHDYAQTAYQCPTCFKSLWDMSSYFKKIDKILDTHQMPPEYQNTKSLVYCNDCETKSTTKYHFLYHKCQNCGGYNTKTIQTLNDTRQETDITGSHDGKDRLSTIPEDITVTGSSSSDMEMMVDESESARDVPSSGSGPPQF
jgi:hypothetical protein